MKYKKELIQALIFVLSSILVLGLVSRYLSPYRGDGIVERGGLYSIGYHIYQIEFPSFSLKKGTIEQTYRFTGTCNCKLNLKFDLMAEPDKQVYYIPDTPKPAFLDTMKLAVKLLEEQQEVIQTERVKPFPSKNTVHLVMPHKTEFHDGSKIKYNFLQNYDYELQISLEVQDELPQPLAIQFVLDYL